MRRTVLVAAAMIVLGGAYAAAQSNEVIDALLGRDVADFGSSLQLILSAGHRVDENASVADAYATFQSLGWRLQSKGIDDSLTAKELSYLIMRSLGLTGGIMYTILPSPRYAFRELVYVGIISRQVPPGRIVSGQQVVRYLGAVLRLTEAQ